MKIISQILAALAFFLVAIQWSIGRFPDGEFFAFVALFFAVTAIAERK